MLQAHCFGFITQIYGQPLHYRHTRLYLYFIFDSDIYRRTLYYRRAKCSCFRFDIDTYGHT